MRPHPPPLGVFAGLALTLASTGLAARATGQDARDGAGAGGIVERDLAVKHRNPERLADLLRPLTSGAPGTALSHSRRRSLLTVRDFPANIGAIERAVRRLDQPPQPDPDVEITLDLVALGAPGPGRVRPRPAVMSALAATLRAQLARTDVRQLLQVTKRIDAGGDARGGAEAPLDPAASADGPRLSYSYELEDVRVIRVAPGGPGRQLVEIGQLRVRGALAPLGEFELTTALRLRAGETALVTAAPTGFAVLITARPAP